MPTAAVTGRKSVATNVVTRAACDVLPVRQIVAIWAGRSEPIAA
jgi:hypothetical protein